MIFKVAVSLFIVCCFLSFKLARTIFISLPPDRSFQISQKQALNFIGSSALMHCCQNLSDLHFDCCNWKACVTDVSWNGLPVPPPEVIAQGTKHIFAFVKAVLLGGSFPYKSCRVMVVGPQMVRSLVCVGFCSNRLCRLVKPALSTP